MPSCEEDVFAIAKSLEKIISGKKEMENAADLIEALSKLPITIEILTKTRIGMTINDLRKKTDDEKLSKKAKSLIKDWKNLLESKPSSSKTRKVDNGRNQDFKLRSTDSPSISNGNVNGVDPKTSNNISTTEIKKNPDECRQKCIEMLENALRILDLPDGTHDPCSLAVRIESKLFEFHHGTTDKYRAAVRSRVFNLRDKKNLALRENVLTGAVNPENFALMTSEEMASDEMKKKREEFTKEAILEHQMSVQEGTPSDMFRCGKCGKNNCTYTQVQTRSADEPMTTFVFCRECGNRWKFC